MRRVRPLALPSLVAMSPCLIAVAFAHAAEETYVIGAADVLEIQVWDNKDLNQTVFVRPDGKISLPLIGEIQVGGEPCSSSKTSWPTPIPRASMGPTSP